MIYQETNLNITEGVTETVVTNSKRCKVFTARNSYLTDRSQDVNTLYNIFIVILLLMLLKAFVYDFVENGM